MIKLKVKPTRRQVLITTGGSLLVAVGVYLTISVLFWSNFESDYQSRQKESLANISQFLKKPPKSDGGQADIEKLSQVSKQAIESQKDLCHVQGLFRWQLIVPAFEAKHDSCRAASRTASEASRRLDKLANYLVYEEKLSQIIAGASQATPETIDTDKVDTIISAWQAAGEEVDGLNPDKDFSPVELKARDLTDQLTKSYEALKLASASKDEAAFMAAQERIGNSYQKATELREEADRMSAQLMDDFESSWSAI